MLEDTNLLFDVNTEDEALSIAWDHIDILEDNILDEELIIKKN